MQLFRLVRATFPAPKIFKIVKNCKTRLVLINHSLHLKNKQNVKVFLCIPKQGHNSNFILDTT